MIIDKILTICLMFSLSVFPSVLFATESNPSHLIAMQLKPSMKETRITFVLTKKTDTQVTYLTSPDRVVLELSNTDKQFNLQNAHIDGSNVSTINTEVMPNHTLRLTFTVTGKVTCNTTFVPNGKNNGVQLQVTITSG